MHRFTRRWPLGIALLAACSTTPKVLDFHFAPAGGGKTYRSTTIERTLRAELGDESQPSIIVVVTPDSEDAKFREQLRILKKLPADELEALFVIGCPTRCGEEVYAMADKTAAKLFGEHPDFQVFILDGEGRVRHASRRVLTAKEIREVVERRWVEPAPPS